MSHLLMMVGLPRSGKSTFARALSREKGYPIVCPDAIRLALHGKKFEFLAEPFVWAIAKVMLRALFIAGHEVVILDATNATRARRKEWYSRDWSVTHMLVDTPKEVCITRAGDDRYMIPVIERMAASWEPLTEEELSGNV